MTAYQVHFQCQEVEMGRFHVKVLCGSLFTLPIYDNIDKNENSLSMSTDHLNLFIDASLKTKVLTTGSLWTQQYLQAFIVEYVMDVCVSLHTCGTEWVNLEILSCGVTLIRCSWWCTGDPSPAVSSEVGCRCSSSSAPRVL